LERTDKGDGMAKINTGWLGKSSRYGLLLSWEKSGFFFILHWNKKRHWIGIGRMPTYLIKNRKYI
jgi:hypothetical protein